MTYEKYKMIALLYRIFQCEKWKYYDGIPTYTRIEEMISDLEQKAKSSSGVESGRIKVEYDKKTDIFSYYLNIGEHYAC